MARRPLGNCPQGLSPLFFHLVAGKGREFCQGLASKEKEGRRVKKNKKICFRKGRRSSTVSFKTTRVVFHSFFLGWKKNEFWE